MEQINPFSITGYKGAEFFCDREIETEQLKKYINNQTNVSLFAFRRLGKTGLINHVFHQFKTDKTKCCIYVDILATTNLKEFIDAMATAIYNVFPSNNTIGKKIIAAIQKLRPILSFDELSGVPTISFNIQAQQQEPTLNQLFSFIDSQDLQIVFAIDEFQQILEYPEKNVEALLRTQLQNLKHSSFIFCGSNQKMMHEIFNNTKRPFFSSCTPMFLDYIPKEKYESFIRNTFNKNKIKIQDDAIDFICKWTILHTFYTQYFCNLLYAKNTNNISIENVKETAIEILNIHENTFFQYRSLLTAIQWKLLKGIALEEKLYHPTAKEFIAQNQLGSPSVVQRAIESLLEKEMIFYNNSVQQPYYEVYNKFLMRWLSY